MFGKLFHIGALFLLLFVTGCSINKYYTIGVDPECTIDRTLKNDIIPIGEVGWGRVNKRHFYTIDQSVNIIEEDGFDELVPIVKSIYKHTQPKKYHKFVNDMKMDNSNDSLVVFRFSHPIIRDGYNAYVYYIEEKVIVFVSGSTGKF